MKIEVGKCYRIRAGGLAFVNFKQTDIADEIYFHGFVLYKTTLNDPDGTHAVIDFLYPDECVWSESGEAKCRYIKEVEDLVEECDSSIIDRIQNILNE